MMTNNKTATNLKLTAQFKSGTKEKEIDLHIFKYSKYYKGTQQLMF